MFEITETEISSRLSSALGSSNVEDCTTLWVSTLPRSAAVLIPFLKLSEQWHILFTRRTENVADHKGQVAFPGGAVEPGDISPAYTALREAREEIGLEPADVKLLGRLQELPTITNYCVTPIVGVMPWPYPLTLEADEVSRAFVIPLAWLADPSHHETRSRAFLGKNNRIPVIYFQPYDGELLWGVSAQITVNLLTALRLI